MAKGQIKVQVGTSVVVPSGRKGVVKSLSPLHTGQRGRPQTLVEVQERDEKGHFISETVTYPPHELKIA